MLLTLFCSLFGRKMAFFFRLAWAIHGRKRLKIALNHKFDPPNRSGNCFGKKYFERFCDPQVATLAKPTLARVPCTTHWCHGTLKGIGGAESS